MRRWVAVRARMQFVLARFEQLHVATGPESTWLAWDSFWRALSRSSG